MSFRFRVCAAAPQIFNLHSSIINSAIGSVEKTEKENPPVKVGKNNPAKVLAGLTIYFPIRDLARSTAEAASGA
jgi:hypothetical protein